MLREATTGTMIRTRKKLTVPTEDYLFDRRQVRSSAGATPERTPYGPLYNLLTAVGTTLRPKVSCVQELADQGTSHPLRPLRREAGAEGRAERGTDPGTTCGLTTGYPVATEP